MNILFTLQTVTPLLEIELELMENHIKSGHNIFKFSCKRDFKTCIMFSYPSKYNCIRCRTHLKIGLSLLSSKVNLISSNISTPYRWTNKIFKNISDLKSFCITDIPLGEAVSSTLISKLRHENFDTVKHSQIINDHIASYMNLYHLTLNTIKDIKPDIVYVFNGRHTMTHPVITACRKTNTDFYTYEVGGVLNRYRTIKNTLPHTISQIEYECEELYNIYGEAKAEEIASDYYTAFRNKKNVNGFVYTTNQKMYELPTNFDKNKKNIVFFTSSEFEFASLPEECGYRRTIFQSDVELLEKISKALLPNHNIHIYVRMHPNLVNSKSDIVQKTTKLDMLPNITVLPPQSNVDTYTLLDNASVVCVSQSTIGAEAAYWGKPVILTATSPYANLGGFYIPTSFQELMSFLSSNLNPSSKIGSIKYGLWMAKAGKEYLHVTRTGTFTSFYKGVYIPKKAKPFLLPHKLCHIIKSIFHRYRNSEYNG